MIDNPYAQPGPGPDPLPRRRSSNAPKRQGGAPKGKRKRKKEPPLVRAGRFVLKWIILAVVIAFKLALLLPIPLFLLYYSWSVDRNGWFQGEQYEREVAAAMLEGSAISHFEKMEEREITKLYVQNLEAAPASAAIGSSRILQLNRSLMKDDTFVNAGMIGAEAADVMSSYYLFDRADRLPGTVVFGIDPWIFSGSEDANTFKRVDMEMYNEFLYYGLGHTDVDVASVEENMTFWTALISPAFFRENLDYYLQNKETGTRPTVVEGNLYQQDTDVKMPDGSVLYSVVTRNVTAEEAAQLAAEAISYSLVNCEYFYELDGTQCALFDEFVQYMQGKGSQVVFFLSPYHPVVYSKVLEQPERYSGFFQVESYVRQYAAQHGIPVYGSYDPLACGCDENDFFDGWHVRDSGIDKFFPGLKQIQKDTEANTLPDPLATTPRLPADTDTVEPAA